MLISGKKEKQMTSPLHHTFHSIPIVGIYCFRKKSDVPITRTGGHSYGYGRRVVTSTVSNSSVLAHRVLAMSSERSS